MAFLLVTADRLEINTERAQFSIKVCSFHSDALRQQADFAIAKNELLLQIGAFELFARLPERQGQQVLFYQRLVS